MEGNIPYDTDCIKDECACCDTKIAVSRRRYEDRGNFCDGCMKKVNEAIKSGKTRGVRRPTILDYLSVK